LWDKLGILSGVVNLVEDPFNYHGANVILVRFDGKYIIQKRLLPSIVMVQPGELNSDK
jgi:hypothetical protein